MLESPIFWGTMLGALSALVAIGGLCALLCRRKGRSEAGGFILGMLAGLIGLVVVALMPRGEPARRDTDGIAEEMLALAGVGLAAFALWLGSHLLK